MADKAISELNAAQQITPSDMFVLEQNGEAKKLSGQILINWLTAAADGHGGIASSGLISTDGLVKTYRFTYADTTFMDIQVVDGRGITSIPKVKTNGLVDTYQINYSDGGKATFQVTNGAKGDPGINANIWIRYASQEPTEQSHDFGELPDAWIGINSGYLDEAPEDWREYRWFQWKGDKGDPGEAAALLSTDVTYAVSDYGNIVPSGNWSPTIPLVPQGKYLWTRVINTFNTGSPATSYSVSRMGMDGSGSVKSVANVSPDENGNVPLTASHIGALPDSGGNMSGSINMNGNGLNGLGTPLAADEAVPKGYIDGLFTSHRIRTYSDPTQFGSTTDATLASLYAAIPAGSLFICNAGSLKDNSWNFPNTSATLVIIKISAARGILQLYPSYQDRQYFMRLVSGSGGATPTGTWLELATAEALEALLGV